MKIEWKRLPLWNVTMRFQLYGLVDGEPVFHLIRYGKHSPIAKKWNAFFKPAYWDNFGNAVAKDRGHTYAANTLREAIELCERHLEKFGAKPDQYKHLTITEKCS
jgi:hypothetical protein